MLSVVQILHQELKEYCSEKPTWKWTISSDNKSLVNKINGVDEEEDDDAARASPKRAPPHEWATWRVTNDNDCEDPTNNWTINENYPTNMTLDPDWDVINEIRWTLEKVGVEGGTIFHILGHQVRKKPYAKVSLQAQLNVNADQLATRFQEHHGKPLPKVLLFPHMSVQIGIDRLGTCTYRLPQTLRRAETDTQLYDHIISRNGWTLHQAATIDWDAHEQAIKKHNKKRIHITKLVHDILPTNSNLHRRNPKLRSCP